MTCSWLRLAAAVLVLGVPSLRAQSSLEARLAVLENRVTHLEAENERLARELAEVRSALARGSSAPAAAVPAVSREGGLPDIAPNLPKVNVNTASLAELETIRGIGPALARRIVEGRPYRSIEELRRIRGIGEALMAELRRQAAVD